MIEFVLALPTWAGGLVAVLLSTGLGLAVYGVSYKFISRYPGSDLKDPTGNLFRVVGMLVSLMLSLAFAEVIAELRAIETAIEREAVAISDTFHSLQRFDADGTREARALVIEYLQAVIDDDWPALADDRLGARAEALSRSLADSVLALKPANAVQEALWSRLLSDLDAASDYRFVRLNNALAQPPVYTYVVVFGFLITMACFGAYRPQVPLVALVSLYTVFVGLVLYLIVALSDPFQGDTGVAPATFEHLVEMLQAEPG